MPKASNLTRLRISGHLPVLHAALSDGKYRALMRIIDNSMPKFDEPIEISSQSRASDKRESKKYRARSFSFGAQQALIAEGEMQETEDEEFEEAQEGLEVCI